MDHTGGNEKIAKSIIQPAGLIGAAGGGNAFNGAGAGIISFENVLNRMSAPTGQAASRPTDAWPTDTFFTVRKNMWYGGEPIEMHHVAAAHTDGDIMVFFRKSDVLVTGPILPGDSFPMIDAEKGGSITGVLAGLNQVVGTAVPEYNQQGGTRIVTGNGRIYNQTDAVEYRDTVTIVRDRIAAMVKKGATLDQVKAAHVSLEYDAQYRQAAKLDVRHVHHCGLQRALEGGRTRGRQEAGRDQEELALTPLRHFTKRGPRPKRGPRFFVCRELAGRNR